MLRMIKENTNKWLNYKLLLFLYLYHLLFIVFAYYYRVNRGSSDALYYWTHAYNLDSYHLLGFIPYGNQFILFINYFFIKASFPFWSGFLLYGTIGFLGIVKFMQWAILVFGNAFQYKGINILLLLFLLPNLHFWTASIGKEPLVFWGIASVFYALATNNYKTFSAIAGSIIILLIRPHVALMLFSAIGLVVVFRKDYSLKRRIAIASAALLIFIISLLMVLQLSHIKYWDWKRIIYFNDFSILSFKGSGSYVPMLDYNYPYKLFTFYFRPLFFDSNALLNVFASIENAIVLAIHLAGIFFIIRFYKLIDFPQWTKIAFLFTFISGLLFVQRYANLGIFMRSKIMFQPFMLVALLYIIKQGFTLINQKQ